ncbi:MAG: hypothetical protein R2834_23105 [Rhodothermales bacterium]
MRSTFAALLIVLVAGCDSAGPGAPADRIDARAIADTTLFTDDAPLVVDLASFFTSTAGKEIVYDARVEGDAVQIERAYDKLTISPVTDGASTIRLTADSPTAEPVEATFQVEVACATSRDAGKVRYFPIEVGATWKYDYLFRDYRVASSQNLEIAGNLIWTVTRQLETCRYTDFLIHERFGGGRQEWSRGSPREAEPVQPENWERLLRVRAVGDSMYIDRYTDGTFPYLSALPWSAPAGAPATLDEEARLPCDRAVCPTVAYRFDEGLGLSRLEYGITSGGLYTVKITLKP